MPQYELNLRDYLRIIHKRRLVLIIVPIITVLAGIFTIPKQNIVYKATSIIKIEERKTIAGLLTEEILYNPADTMESETKLIRSYPVMKQVASRLGHTSDSSSVEEVNDAIARLQANVGAETEGNTNMIKITVSSDTAKNATDLANLVAQVYIEQSHAEKAKMATHGRKFIEEQLSALEERTRVIEDSLKKIGEGTKNIKLAEPIEQKLLELQFQLGELSQKYTDRHPNIIQVREQIRQLEAQVKGFSGQEIDYSRLLREAEVNKKLYSMLKEKLEEARITEAQKISDVSVVVPAVSAIAPITVNTKAKILISLFMGLVLGLAFAFIIETMDTSMGTIEDVENIVKLPVVGVLPSIGQEGKEDNSLFARLRIRLAGRHKTDEEERAVHLVAHFNPQSTIAEAYRNVFTNLKLSSARKTIMVTSSGPREGKSTVVCNLGIVAAQVGLKTLIVSSDLRRPVVAKNFGISNEFGLRDLITGTMTIDQALKNITDIMMGEIKFDNIRKTPGIENITILPSGKPPSNPVELLESKKIDELISIFKVKFDVVIFDAAPILPVTDASILAPKMDCVAIVYEIGRTSRDALVRAKIQLENVGAKICGVILNHTRAQTEGINAYPYYYQYRYKYDTMHKESRLAKKETRKK